MTDKALLSTSTCLYWGPKELDRREEGSTINCKGQDWLIKLLRLQRADGVIGIDAGYGRSAIRGREELRPRKVYWCSDCLVAVPRFLCQRLCAQPERPYIRTHLLSAAAPAHWMYLI